MVASPSTRTITSPARTDARSVASTQTFDAGDRLTGVTSPAIPARPSLTRYDDTTSGNKGVGRLTSLSRTNPAARPASTTISATSNPETRVIGGKTYTVSYSYDLANRLTEIIYPSGRYVDYTYRIPAAT